MSGISNKARLRIFLALASKLRERLLFEQAADGLDNNN